MKRDDVIRMAREAGMVVVDDVYSLLTFLERFAALVAAAEREACAKVLDEMAAQDKRSNYYQVAAKTIRARK